MAVRKAKKAHKASRPAHRKARAHKSRKPRAHKARRARNGHRKYAVSVRKVHRKARSHKVSHRRRKRNPSVTFDVKEILFVGLAGGAVSTVGTALIRGTQAYKDMKKKSILEELKADAKHDPNKASLFVEALPELAVATVAGGVAYVFRGKKLIRNVALATAAVSVAVALKNAIQSSVDEQVDKLFTKDTSNVNNTGGYQKLNAFAHPRAEGYAQIGQDGKMAAFYAGAAPLRKGQVMGGY
jgi:hypothetical protein